MNISLHFFIAFLLTVIFFWSIANIGRFFYRLYTVIKTQKGIVTKDEDETTMFTLSFAYAITYIIFLFI